MSKKFIALFAAAVLALSAVGCSNGNSSAAETQTSPADTTVAVTPAAEENSPLSNKNASEEAKKLYSYISETYRNGIISGQQESTWMGSDQYEFEYIYEKTGKYPAIRGLDYMNNDFNGVNKRAADWYERGGIVTICWHCGCDFNGSWDECMKTELADWDKALTEGTEEYEKLIAGMDKGAAALKELKEQNIPVLWRPFHELDGGWFWWSHGGADNFKKLWTIMYDRYTNYWELDNLIWVFGYSHNGKDFDKWYPGAEYVDIIGADSYDDGANEKLYQKVVDVAGDEMPICFHECGRIPTVQQLKDGKADWVWFMTWHTEYITDHNTDDDLKAIYNDEYVITLDELPDLK
ncbi:MAG: glycoside hydrolase family 26 protein [Ruminococcus sp.]|nr:glycoside hydrolase family 26 protein [Ruminococcus sp.]MCM1380429.1 glycoside hydrolase family 26 protein [Muribaculaceae bacterium]MCM1478141.1 glycoside hydrolase family 26 protein [Muribaculaceae bacterium]